MVYKLSKILRRLLRKQENLVTLREELSFIDDYLAIEMVRFGDKLHFEKEVEPGCLDMLVPSMLLQPLVENSIRHGLASKVSGGTIRVRGARAGSRLLITVEDNGPGIADAEMELVFQPFYRALGNEADGSGLGLPIVLEIAQQHAAQVSLEAAQPGRPMPGARFSVRFPSVG